MYAKILFVVFAGVVFSGCMLNREIRLNAHSSSCSAYGFSKGSAAFAQCMQREEVNWQNKSVQ